MIKVNISQLPVYSNQLEETSYIADATSALDDLRVKKVAGILKSEDFKTHWKIFKFTLWTQQHKKCCFCEKQINEQDSQVEHYRPKAKVKTKTGNIILGYWWLAYKWLNFVVSCATCNRQKSIDFPLVDEGARVTQEIPLDAGGGLGHEQPLLINPGLVDPEIYFEYDITRFPISAEVLIKGKDSGLNDHQRGNTTIKLLDLNRERVNKKRYRDNLPGKRGKKYHEIKELWDELTFYKRHIHKLKSKVLPLVDPALVPNVQTQIQQLEEDTAKLEIQIQASAAAENEFAGMIRWYSSMRHDAPSP